MRDGIALVATLATASLIVVGTFGAAFTGMSLVFGAGSLKVGAGFLLMLLSGISAGQLLSTQFKNDEALRQEHQDR